MTKTVLLIIVYLLLVILGAETVVGGASRIARRLHTSEFLVGMLIIGFGTSLPELVVSLTGAIENHPEISVGNIVGTNIFNLLGILGISVLILPIQANLQNRKFDLPAATVITLFVLCICLSSNMISRGEGVAMLLLMTAFVCLSISLGQEHQTLVVLSHNRSSFSLFRLSRKQAIVMLSGVILVGMGMLLIGGYRLVNECVTLAEMAGVSDRTIAILVLATGTSLPELVTSIAAARNNMSQLLLGNIIGSNVFNLLFILGLSAILQPLQVSGMHPADWIGMGVSVTIVYLIALIRPHIINRWHGMVMLLLLIIYTIAIIGNY